MNIIQLLEQLKRQPAQNQPLLPTTNPLGGDEWVNSFASAPQSNGLPPRNRSDIVSPAPMPEPAPMPSLEEVTVPPRSKRLPFGEIKAGSEYNSPLEDEITTLDREKKSGIVDQPFYKDNDRMAMMAAALSEGFGGMTMRGKSGMSTLNKATFADARKNIRDNKTFDYLVQNDPEMAKVMSGIPAEYRGDFMKMYHKSLFADQLGEGSTADIRNYRFREGLSPEGQKLWDNQKTGEKMITLPDNSVIAVSRDGSSRVVLSSEDALAMTAAGADAEQGGKAAGEEFRTMYKAARYTQDNLDGLMQTRNRLVNSKDEGGIFQPVKLFMDRVKAEFGDIDGAARATNEELLQMEGIERTMQWFLNSGLGARGQWTHLPSSCNG